MHQWALVSGLPDGLLQIPKIDSTRVKAHVVFLPVLPSWYSKIGLAFIKLYLRPCWIYPKAFIDISHCVVQAWNLMSYPRYGFAPLADSLLEGSDEVTASTMGAAAGR